MRQLPFATALAVIMLGLINAQAGDAKKDDAKNDKKKIQGTWEATTVVLNGVPIPDDTRKGITFTFTGDTMTLNGPGAIGKRECTFKLDPTMKPKALDTVPQGGPNQDNSGPAIYDLTGDTLKLCVPKTPTDERPKTFESTKESNLGLFVLKRSKS